MRLGGDERVRENICSPMQTFFPTLTFFRMERCKIGWVIAPAPSETGLKQGRKGKEKGKMKPQKSPRDNKDFHLFWVAQATSLALERSPMQFVHSSSNSSRRSYGFPIKLVRRSDPHSEERE